MVTSRTTDSAPIRPSEKLARIYDILVQTYGIHPWEPDGDALGGLIATILSQHTSDTNSARAFAELVRHFPRWEQVRDAPVVEVEDAIRTGGLAHQKAARIQAILRELSARSTSAAPELTGLSDIPLDDAQTFLRTLPGVGPKTAACILLFSLGRPAFPVDTHVWRVSRRLGLIGPRVNAEAAHDLLLDAIPADWRHTMHVDLIAHGRRICHARSPQCPVCPLRGECEYYWRVVVSAS